MKNIKITKKLMSLLLAGGLILAPISALANNKNEVESKGYILKEDKMLYCSPEHREEDEQKLLKKGTIVTGKQITENGYIYVFIGIYCGYIEYSNLEETEKPIIPTPKPDEVNIKVKKTESSFDELTDQEIYSLLNKVKNQRESHKFMFRLYFPEANHDVAVYSSFTQTTVDHKDSAGSTKRAGGRIVADHNNQGFDCIKDLTEDYSVAYTNDGEIIREYLVVKKMVGKNTGYDLLDEDGQSVFNENDGGLSLYTCNENWRNVTIVYLQPTGRTYTRNTKRLVK